MCIISGITLVILSYNNLYHDVITASVYAMAGPLGALTTGIVMELWGRRKSSITATVGFVIGWILLSAAQNSTVIVYARAIEGFFRTSLFTVLPVFCTYFKLD
mgnify:CR=1 FL=1